LRHTLLDNALLVGIKRLLVLRAGLRWATAIASRTFHAVNAPLFKIPRIVVTDGSNSCSRASTIGRVSLSLAVFRFLDDGPLIRRADTNAIRLFPALYLA
jgi:hypothetical protein